MLSHVGENARHSLHQLTPMLLVREVQELARHDSGLTHITLRPRSGQSALSEICELVENGLDHLDLLLFLVGDPAHFVEHFVQIFPVEAHRGALSILKLRINSDVNSSLNGRGRWGFHVHVLARVGISAIIRVTIVLCVTGNTISGITGFTGAPESTIQISAIRIFVAIMTLSITFIDINTTVFVKVVGVAGLGTHAFSIVALRSTWACTGTAVWPTALKSVSDESVFALADLGVAVADRI